MFKYTFSIFVAFIFISCSSIPKNIDIEAKKEKYTTTKKYMNISKDAILEAAKKVFVLASKDEFRIYSYRNSLEVSKIKVNYYPFFAITSEDKWELTINEKDNFSEVKLNIFKVTDYEEEDPLFLSDKLHELLWSRIDYLLGLNDNWTSCFVYKFKFNFDDALCDIVDLDNVRSPENKDIIKNILISDRVSSKSILDINSDLLSEDIEFSIEDKKIDILQKEDIIDSKIKTKDENSDSLDKEIEELDKMININIDKNLDAIEKNFEDEEPLNNK